MRGVLVALHDTLFGRSGKKVWAASWCHDGSAQGPKKGGLGNNGVIAGIVVTLALVARPVCLAVAAWLVVNNTTSALRWWLAARMIDTVARALADRTIHVVADAAYAGAELRGLGQRVSPTTRLRRDAALDEPAPPRTGKRGRPRRKGPRLSWLSVLASALAFTPTTVCR